MLDKLPLRIREGYALTPTRALELMRTAPLDELCRAANEVRRQALGSRADTCSIMNARSGRCTEDCKWCSQSAHHAARIEIYPLTDVAQALSHARAARAAGVGRFSLVTSGRTMSDAEIERACEIYREIIRELGVESLGLCASMGLLNRAQLERLRASGVTRYHCNIETAPSYFPSLCTTHTMAEKLHTIRLAREVGMGICSGGIIGMGETAEQRVEMAFAIREIGGVDSIPINILNPIPGTALENTPPLTDEEVLRTFAIFRLVHPGAYIRFAGGRTRLSPETQQAALHAGCNAAIVGDLLTTIGSTVAQDKALFSAAGFTL